ncbi:polysaccharide pyruvyl transferase [Desulfuromonas soudanensis]|uniref:Polysaccharide pyruvyl transferase n=1 Tax=Desulfuromonas soudanensis TaxID=1603606 RepID=A0A0M3QFY5_9BACT|nr:polysaccharide pyruvyl transferase family protein [Desulfuromonas soudanensis]ALC17039.1 polysaccharide pyruvyl transferase [Desulfuromonas soudanensis]
MKVGLLTIHDIYNYGSVLQAYATQRSLASLDLDTYIIDYKYPNALHKTNRSLISELKARSLSFANSALKDLILDRKYSTYCRNYAESKKAWYQLSEKGYPTRKALLENAPICDAYVVGSDQVWHPRSAANDPSFFLDFAPAGCRKISYASSFGATSIPRELFDNYRAGLLSLDFISVREKSGVKLVRELTGRNAELVLDPTLLLTREEWMAQAVFPPIDKPYILCYGANSRSTYMERLALHIQRHTGWKIVRINGTFFDAFDRKIDYVLDAGPREWLGYMSNAALIIGQSFHATAFAVNFGKPFVSLLRGLPDHDSRQRDFLDMVGCGENIIVCGEPMPDIKSINFFPEKPRTESILCELRESSFEFLAKTLS